MKRVFPATSPMDRRQAITTLAGVALALTAGAMTLEDARAAAPAAPVAPRATLAAEVFPLSAVRLLDSPFHRKSIARICSAWSRTDCWRSCARTRA